ncbi:hypothetical protein [Streptomyces sp. SID161]|uniref:hypothetical protein n=1 Tax=Streptomyces sp. SID161 TaxID=2690251 RepID=UPI001371F33D|nr:hypothetical protein [Streptomyces sp. SID161]MYW46382.1 hypothetical protein [Streptomyces sp. SID161]
MTKNLPPFVTFTSGAQLLEELKLVDSITADGLRYLARQNPEWWRFGDREDQVPYVMAGTTRTMETGIFIAMFRDGPRRGGRGRK